MDRAQKRALHISGVHRDRIKAARSVNPAQPAQQPQRGRTRVFPGADRLQVQQGIELGAVELRAHVPVVIFGDRVLVPVGAGFFEGALAKSTGQVGPRAKDRPARTPRRSGLSPKTFWV